MLQKYFSLIVLSSLLFLLSSSVSGAIFIVTKAVDTNDGVCDSDCSLREAVAAANAGSDTEDVIVFSPVISDVPLDMNNGEMQILSGNSIAILGFGADHLTVQRTIHLQDRFFYVEPGASLAITGMTLTGGTGTGASGGGGAIMNRGTLLADGIFFYKNVSFGSPAGGGGLMAMSDGPTTIRNSSFSENGAAAGAGLNCDNNFGNDTGPIFIINSTFSNANPNNLQFREGNVKSTCDTTFQNSTITSNLIYGSGFLFLRNTVAANISSNSADSDGSNIITVASGFSPAPGDQVGVNPMLGPFQLNGGRMPTYALLAGSPAIDAGKNSTAAALPFDQRGFLRIVDGNGDTNAVVDIGAYEYLSTAPMVKSVSVGGQVVSATGVPYFRANVTLIDIHGVSHSALTNSFGYYSFSNIAPDEYCALIVSAKRGRFKMQVINSGLGLSNVNFTSN